MNIPRILHELSAGNLVIAPTDTIYGILAGATSLAAIQKVFAAKRRDQNKALIVLVSDLAMLQNYVTILSPLEQKIIERYTPGRLTILLPHNANIPPQVTGGRDLVGIRIPDHAELRQIIHQFGKPIISTSANLAGEDPITNPQELRPELLQHIAYVEDSGTINDKPSSLIQIENNNLKILRPGSVADKITQDWPNLTNNI